MDQIILVMYCTLLPMLMVIVCCSLDGLLDNPNTKAADDGMDMIKKLQELERKNKK